MDKLKGCRSLTRIAAYVDLVAALILMCLDLFFIGILMLTLFQDTKSNPEELSEIPDGASCASLSEHFKRLQKISSFERPFVIVMLAAICFVLLSVVKFFVENSLLLFIATKKCTDNKTAIDSAWVWLIRNLGVVGFCILALCIPLPASTNCLPVSLTLITTIFVITRALLISFVSLFIKQLNLVLSSEPKELEDIVVTN